MIPTQERPIIVANMSSRLVDIRTRVAGVGSGLVDSENNVHVEWASPTTIGHQIDKLIKETDNSMHGFHVPPQQAQTLASDMKALLLAKNAVSAIQVFGVFANVSESDRFFAANTVARMIVESEKEDQFVNIRTRLAATLGHRQSKRSLMTEHRVSLGK